ncbi:sensor histidine kinase [Desulfosporosinus meridiei]|uniref:histidine kinase n=1 Tax=Desulfosporosinus meridiei (strain ATCC BAA-275 / DSM 13257 / KCTC 12902 / NCIMB 13706 / S10) TaxID=768704 RepID=J7IQN5_DESMD|nr:HAMP domain-containing sensor histidine kinase [Desulfosporosinus meridiei]AFQ43930.1 signal transduction histidine kinase [Desulfosporosinus meridiei DSM 13257]
MKEKSWLQNLLWLCFVACMLAACFVASYLLMLLIYRFIGRPSEPWSDMLYGTINLVLIVGSFMLVAFIHQDDRSRLAQRTLEALERIAQGNFDVFIERDKHGHFLEITDSINKMAKELGSMEQLRQDFISNISHEFQSPLTSISGYAALLRKDGATLKQQEYAAIIEEESKRLSKLADNLLRLSALERSGRSITKAPFRLDRQLENVVLLLEPQWKAKNIIPETTLPKITVYGNEDLLKQVWINLLVNALKFTPENGELNVSLKQDGETVVCIISDNGIGIAPAEQMHIFERFYKVDKSRDRSLGGNGLGLALVKKIINLHQGKVTVESELGKGTVFQVKLPTKE